MRQTGQGAIGLVLMLAGMIFAQNSTPRTSTLTADEAYIRVQKHLEETGIPGDFLDSAFSHPEVQVYDAVVERFRHPYEEKPYPEYRKLFVTSGRIQNGKRFYQENRDLIAAVVRETGVDPYILISIAGVESNYGEIHKQFPVFGALYTAIHRMPKRANWAARELAEFLIYCYRDRIDPHAINGSYAGAFGYGQFIPSSFNAYAVDFDGDGTRQPYEWPDVLGSIGNYLVKNGYQKGGDFQKGSPNWKSIWAYNHSDNYVKVVLELRTAIEKEVLSRTSTKNP